MTDLFYTTLKARIAQLVQDLRYTHLPTGTMVAPQIIDLMLPRPTAPVDEGEEYPFVRWMVFQGEFIPDGLASFTLALDGGIYAEDVAAGNSGISALCLALGQFVHAQAFTPYSLNGPIRFTIGNPDAEERNPGVQSHPYYHCRLLMDFSMTGVV